MTGTAAPPGPPAGTPERPPHRQGRMGRAARNTAIQATGEITGKLATLALFIAAARTLTGADLGVYVFAFAFCTVVEIPIDLGLDRLLLREIARDDSQMNRMFVNVLGLKAAVAIPTVAIAFGLLSLLGYDSITRETVYVLTAGFLIDSISRTAWSGFIAFERSDVLAILVVFNRVGAAILGLLVLHFGGGVVSLAATYTAANFGTLPLIAFLMRRKIVFPRFHVDPRRWRAIAVKSLPFAVQDVFTALLFKLDALILSLMSTKVAVGRYGSAYRLFESTLFVPYSLAGAFLAMFTYLDHRSDPPVNVAFHRSIKLALVALVPCGVIFGVLAHPLCRLFFGPSLESAGDPLRLLAPAVVGLGVVTLSSALVVSRKDATIMVWVAGVMTVLNIILNVILIPIWDDSGAAAAMLATEVIGVAVCFVIVRQTIGALDWRSMLAAPLVAGAAMILAMLPFRAHIAPALAIGLPLYALALIGVERLVSPDDLRSLTARLRRRMASPAPGQV